VITSGRSAGDDELRAGENAHAGGLGVEHGAQAEEEVGQLGGDFLEHADRARGRHGELDGGQTAVGERLRAIEQAVRGLGADQGDDFLGLKLRENGVFFHG